MLKNRLMPLFQQTLRNEPNSPVLTALCWLPVTFRINGLGQSYVANSHVKYLPSRTLQLSAVGLLQGCSLCLLRPRAMEHTTCRYEGRQLVEKGILSLQPAFGRITYMKVMYYYKYLSIIVVVTMSWKNRRSNLFFHREGM